MIKTEEHSKQCRRLYVADLFLIAFLVAEMGIIVTWFRGVW